jgi:hypothetical protein
MNEQTKTNSFPLVRKIIILIERSPLVGEFSFPIFVDRGVPRGQLKGSPRSLISVLQTGVAISFK